MLQLKVDSIPSESLPSIKKGRLYLHVPTSLRGHLFLLFYCLSYCFHLWFDFDFFILLHDCPSRNQIWKDYFFSMYKTLVRFDLDHDVLWSNARVSGMKTFYVFGLSFIQSKITKCLQNFEKLRFYIFDSNHWVYTQFWSWSNWTEAKPSHLIQINFFTWSKSFSWWPTLFNLIRIKLCTWFESLSFTMFSLSGMWYLIRIKFFTWFESCGSWFESLFPWFDSTRRFFKILLFFYSIIFSPLIIINCSWFKYNEVFSTILCALS